MNTLLLSAEGNLGLEIALIIAIAIVGVLIILVSLVALILRVKIFFSYWVTNREETEAGYTGGEAARSLLDELGYTDVQVKKAGFFSALLYGNHYNPKKKTVYLRASTLNRKNVTSVGLALQKVGVVVQDETGGLLDDEQITRILKSINSKYNLETLPDDLRAINAISRIRRGRRLPSIERCKAVFVTKNTALVSATKQCIDEMHCDYGFPIAITGEDLCVIAWIKDFSVDSSLKNATTRKCNGIHYSIKRTNGRVFQTFR